MPPLTIKGVSPALHEKLKNRVECHRRSVDTELLTILERTRTPSRKSIEEAIAEAGALNGQIGTPFNSSLIEEEKRDSLMSL